MNELELRLQGQEKEMKDQVNKFQELQLQLEKTKVDLIEKEKILNKTRDEVVRTTAQYEQAAAKVLDFSMDDWERAGFLHLSWQNNSEERPLKAHVGAAEARELVVVVR